MMIEGKKECRKMARKNYNVAGLNRIWGEIEQESMRHAIDMYRRSLNRIWKAVKDYRLIIEEDELEQVRESQLIEYCEAVMKADIMAIMESESKMLKERL